MALITFGFGPTATLTSLVLFGLDPAAPVETEETCTSVIAHDFTTESAPFYPVANHNGFWRDPAWDPPTAFSPPTAGFPDLHIANNAEIVGGELTYITDASAANGAFGNIDANALDWLSLFNAYGGLRTIYFEAECNFYKAAVYDVWAVPFAAIMVVHPETAFDNSFMFAATDADGPPSGDIVFKLYYCSEAGITTVVDVATKPRSFADGIHKFRVEMTPSTPLVPGSTINHTLNNDGVARVYIDDVLEYEDESITFRTVYSFQTQINSAFIVGSARLGPGFVGGYTYFDFGYCDIEDEEEPPPPTEGGGPVPEGINPPPGVFPTIPLLFVTITTVDDVIRGYAETGLNDPALYYSTAGYKPAKLIGVSSNTRELSDETGAYRFSQWRFELADTDRAQKSLQAAGALIGAKVDLYLIDDASRRAFVPDAAYRVASGVVAKHRALSGFRYEFEVEDKFGNLMADALTETLVPRLATIENDSIPGLQFQFDETVIPICYGRLSDENLELEDTMGADGLTPQGVVPARYMGPVDLANIGGSGLVDAYMVCGHACTNIIGVFYNQPDTPTTRLRVPSSAFGSILWAPFKTGWIAKTGQAGQYADYNGLRYTVIFLAQHIPYTATFINEDGTTETREINIAEYARNGSISITVNLEGIDANGDGTGDLIDDIDFQWQHFLTNFVFADTPQSGIGGWADIPDFGDYSLIDSDTVLAAKAVGEARIAGGYKGAFLIGRGGQQQTAADVLQEMCFSGDMDMGTNRHGQIVLHREDTGATLTATYTAANDILEDGFETDLQRDTLATTMRYRYAYRYAEATAPVPSTPTGWASPERLTAQFQEWLSGTQFAYDIPATANIQREIVADANLFCIRNPEIAADVIAKKLARFRGPSTPRDGSRVVNMTTGLQGFQKDTVDQDLGSYPAITHPEGLTGSGWTAQKTYLRGITFDAARFAVTHHSRALIT